MVTGEPRITLLYQVIVKIAPEFDTRMMERKDFSTVARKTVSVVLTLVSGLGLTWFTTVPAMAQKGEPSPTPPASISAAGRPDTAPAKPNSGVAVDPKTYV